MKKFFQNKFVSIIWALARIWLGWHWLEAGWHKLTGDTAFSAVGFLNGTLAKVAPAEGSASVTQWYGWLAENIFIPAGGFISILIVAGEILVGIALIVGIFTRFALYMGALMNLNFMLAGTVGNGGVNPVMFTLSIILLALGAATYLYGVDRWFLAVWKKWMNKIFKKTAAT